MREEGRLPYGVAIKRKQRQRPFPIKQPQRENLQQYRDGLRRQKQMIRMLRDRSDREGE